MANMNQLDSVLMAADTAFCCISSQIKSVENVHLTVLKDF